VAAISLELLLPVASSDLPEMPQSEARATHSFLFGLASSGACTATFVTKSAVSFYLAFSPLPTPLRAGGLFSVALSIPLPIPAVSRHFAL